MTRFQRINLGIGLAALALVACMAISQTQGRLGAEAGTGSAYATK
jgi:hypothetical protein